jgi:hypothetical protein
MNCRKAIRQLPAYLDHELSRRDVSELERHLEVCVFCSTELAAFRGTSRMLDEWKDISPRRCSVSGVITQIMAEERGVARKDGVRVRFLKQQWLSTVLRTAAAMMFLVGVGLLSLHIPRTRDVPGGLSLGELEAVPPAKALLTVDEDYLKPSEYVLFQSGMHRPTPLVTISSRGSPVRHFVGENFAVEAGALPEVNHVYFPGEGMAVESLIPVALK